MDGDATLRPFIGNPFVKKQNRDWAIEPPASLVAPISPPLGPRRGIKQKGNPPAALTVGRGIKPAIKDLDQSEPGQEPGREPAPPTAAIEAGEVQIPDHLKYFTRTLSPHVRSPSQNPNQREPRLSIPAFADLYTHNQSNAGCHFVIHQHDHPIAGVHYDLRLQFSATSSVSWAIMYGMPGNANSLRLNRNATETRVHNVWVGRVVLLLSHPPFLDP